LLGLFLFSARCDLSKFTVHLVLVLLVSQLGCQTNKVNQRAALDAFDLQEMTDMMAASIAADPEVQAAMGREGQLTVVVMPVENELTGEVLPLGRAQAFTARVRALLSNHSPGKYRWILNRDYFYALRDRELEVDKGPSPAAINPRFTLTATFKSLAKEDSRGRRAYYLCQYQLVDLSDRSILWVDQYEVKKVAMKGFLD
jgi:hypothetical protein